MRITQGTFKNTPMLGPSSQRWQFNWSGVGPRDCWFSKAPQLILMCRQNSELAALEFELSRVPGVGLDICYLILSHKHETNKKFKLFTVSGLLELGFYCLFYIGKKKKISRLPFYSQNLKYKMAKTHTVSWGGD